MKLATHKSALLLLVFALLGWRIFYGLSQNFGHEDVRQIYLLGLKYYTTGLWPYFGPDIIHTGQQIPGALQSLLVGVPLHLLPWPEAPFILVNLLSMTGIIVLGVYLARRFPRFSLPLMVLWLATLPAMLQISTNVYNPSYMLLPACLFFVAYFESQTKLRTLGWNAVLIGAAMGFAVMVVFQLHMSWPLFAPYILSALVWPHPSLDRRRLLAGLVGGALLSGSLIMPTLLHFGLSSLWVAGVTNSGWHLTGLIEAPTTFMHYFSLASYEVFGFNLGSSMEERCQFILAHRAITVVAMVLLVGLVWQGGITVRMIYRQLRGQMAPFPELSLFILTFLWIAALFILTPQPPALRNFYVVLPVVVLAMVRIFASAPEAARMRRILLVLITASLAFHTMVGAVLIRDVSLYHGRDALQAAIQQKNYHLFGERRKGTY